MTAVTAILQVGNRIITAEEIIPLLTSYQMLPRLLVGPIVDRAIAHITCTPEEIADNYQQFCEKNQLTTETERQTWLKRYSMTPEQLEASAKRALRIEKFKQTRWGHKLESYFLSHKSQLDKVIYSLIRTKDINVAQELYFRLQEGEQSFAELARKHSQGPETQTSGLMGPSELSCIDPTLAKILLASQPGQLWLPIRLGEWSIVVRLEKFITARLDKLTRQRLLNELFADWLEEQLNQLGSVRHF